MRFTNSRVGFWPAALLALSLAAVACSEDSTAPVETGSIDVFFNLNVDDAPLSLLNSMIYSTPAGTKYSIKVLRFVISDVILHADDGRDMKVADIHYFDIGDASTQTFRNDAVPHANFTSVSFTFGLDEQKNVRDKYLSMFKFHNIMQWPRELGANLGYHYMQLEGNYEKAPGGETGGYTTHTGARQLDGTNPQYPDVVDPTPVHHFFTVTLPFTPAHIHEGGHGELEISFNLNDWYLDSTPADGDDTSYDFTALGDQMIMGDLDAQHRLQANGRYCFSATLTATGGHDH